MSGENAWAYLAVSSEKQADTLANQRQIVVDEAHRRGFVIERFFPNDLSEGVGSGKDGPRKLFLRLISELKMLTREERPQWIIMIRLDRVSRGSVMESGALLHDLKQMGVRVWTCDSGEERLDSAMGELITAAKLALSEHENAIRRQKARDEHRRRRREGLHAGHPPYGVVLELGRPKPYEPEAAIVREIFSRRLAGWGTHRLARYAAQHAPPKRSRSGEPRALHWGESTVNRMLSCLTYRGLVVDEETFDAAQGLSFGSIDRTAKHPWPLRGAIRCTCGHLLSTAYSGPKRHRIRYYVCRNVAVHDRYPFHRADLVEAQFVEVMRQIQIEPGILFTEEDSVDAGALRDRLHELQTRRDDLALRRRRAWELAEQADIDPGELSRRIGELTEDHKEVEQAIREVQRTLGQQAHRRGQIHDATETMAQMVEAWPHAEPQMQREIATMVAGLVRGLWLEPPERASTTKLLRGIDR